jgi:CarD family transcriptional regulator
MFKLGDKVIDKSGKIFEIENIEDKDFGAGPEPYFVLKPFFDYDFNPGYHAYIPVSRADVLLRPIMNKEEALELIDSFERLETYPDVSPRERKVYFTKVIASGDRFDLLRVIKTLSEYREERLRENKPFSDFDKRLLQNLTMLLNHEISLALSIPVSEVSYFIANRTGNTLI